MHSSHLKTARPFILVTLLSFSIGILLLGFLPLLAQTGGLAQNVKDVTSRIRDMALYPNLAKKRLYGSVEKNRSIRFDLISPETSAESLVIGIATDGSLREYQLIVYDGTFPEEIAPILRNEKVTNESQWVFEIISPPAEVVIEIKNLSGSQPLSIVEIVHGYYYGYAADKQLNKPIPSQGNPANNGNKPNNTSSEKLSPNDIQNRVEFFKIPIGK